MQLQESDIATKEVLDWQGVHLIHFRFSSCSQKSRIFLNLKGIEWQSHHLNLMRQQNYEPWFLGINPRGLVPVLVHDGQVHIESNDILTYLDKAFPERPLIPEALSNEIQSGLAEEDDLHMDIRTLTMRYLTPKQAAQKKPELLEAYANDAGTVQGNTDPHKEEELRFWRNFAAEGITDFQASQAAKNFHAVYERLDRTLAQSNYLAGDDICLLDIAWFIYTQRLSLCGYPFATLHPNVSKWFSELSNNPAFAKEVAAPLPMRLAMKGMQHWHRIRGKSLTEVAGF